MYRKKRTYVPRRGPTFGKENRTYTSLVETEALNEPEIIDLDELEDEELEEIDNNHIDKDYKPTTSAQSRKRKSTNNNNFNSESTSGLVECPSSPAMTENQNILNLDPNQATASTNINYEPSTKKICPNQQTKNFTNQIFEDLPKIFFKDILTDLHLINSINTFDNDLDIEENTNFPKTKSKTKTTPSSFKTSFYVGEHLLELVKVDNTEQELINELENFKFKVYQTFVAYSQTYQEKFKCTYLNDESRAFFKNIDIQDRVYYLLITINNSNTSSLFKIEETELNSSIIRLFASKHIKLYLDSIKSLEENKLKLSLKIYLTDKNNVDEIVDENPSSNYIKKNQSLDLHFLMTKFYLSRINSNISHQIMTEEYSDHMDIEIDDKRSKVINENLFDLVYDLHKNEGSLNDLIACKNDLTIQKLSFLKPSLRPYQINAIKWMLFKENFSFNKSLERENDYSNDIHPLYIKLKDAESRVIYYHKYLSVFTSKMPMKKKCFPGGILADEMGLGKTLEVLTLIMINPRPCIQHQKFKIKIEDSKKQLNKKSFSCLCGNTPNSFKADAYNKKIDNDCTIYQCVGCSVWSHVKCLNYRGKKEEFLCLECCTKVPPISSGCTLIVTPSIISHQWADEIKKHVKKKLNVLVYTGTQNSFIQPKDLASLDICITTYDVLSNELSHVFAIENMRILRKAKRFMNIPSPLMCVEWWRICLDEAQMVHSTNSRCAEMANRLDAINRWCVTGTPIGRSLGDLHGLFTFIREDPYTEKKWFKYCLFETFMSGDKMPMAKAVSNVLWRTAKRFVEDQINIPRQTEKCYWLDFSPFESHLYQRVLDSFRESRKISFITSHNNFNDNFDDNNNRQKATENSVEKFFSKFSNQNIRLDEIDRTMIDQLLTPLIDLRLACNHPQLVLRKRTFMAQNYLNKKEKLLTMEKSLEILMKKTQSECDNIFRLMTMHSNAIAGLYIIKGENKKSIETYQNILDSEKEFDSTVKLDLVQKVHTYHNFIDILKLEFNSANKNDTNLVENLTLQLELLQKQLLDCEKSYLKTFFDAKLEQENSLKLKSEELEKILTKKNDTALKWLLDALDNVERSSKSKEFWEKLNDAFSSTSYLDNNISSQIDDDDDDDNFDPQNVKIAYTICGKEAKTFNEIKYIFVTEFDNIVQCRKELNNKMSVFNKVDNDLVKKSSECHLRRDLNLQKHKGVKCELCKLDQAFNSYVKCLFSKSEDVIKLISEPKQNENEEDESDEQFSNQQIATTTRSDLEKFIKILLSHLRNEENHVSNGKEFLEMYLLLKEEYKLNRQYWTNVSHLINAMDELDMVKIRLRLLYPGEKNPFKLEYLIEPGTISFHFDKHEYQYKECRINLGKKLGQLLYLKNSLKTFNLVENQENTEACPICQCNLGYEWYIMSCGHLFCKECYLALLKSENSYISNTKRYIRCALCRESCAHEESHLVSTKKQIDEVINEEKAHFQKDESFLKNENYLYNNRINELSHIRIKGDCNSAKVEGIVKCLIKILREDNNAKCLIFSENVTMLELIIDLLKNNQITHVFIKDNQSLQKKIDEFKKDSDINVLLMPYSFGANGLNIIEATHVLLAEPTLNKSQEIQAIGRVHRIGQTKQTFVYRFMIKNSIEDYVYNMFKSNTTYSDNTQNDINQPTCSKTLDKNCETNELSNHLTLNDLKNLFLNL